jgi:hypothetical protein
VVEIEKEIFLITGRPDLPAWLKTIYLDKNRQAGPITNMLDFINKLMIKAATNPTFKKVNIQSYRMAGKIHLP